MAIDTKSRPAGRRWAGRAGAFLAGLLLATPPAQAETGLLPVQGLANPSLALNLSGAKDYSPGLQFLDLIKMMRPWVAHSGTKDRMKARALEKGGYLDASGWPVTIPDGYETISTYWQWTSLPLETDRRDRDYVLTYKGTGKLRIENAQVLERIPGRVVFRPKKGDNLYLRIYQTDPEGTGDNIRDISIIAEEDLPLHEAGAVFNPDWVRLIADARQLRFMDWMRTNNSAMTSWNQRPRPDEPNLRLGVPVEYLVQLANEVGAEPWFTMPHRADEDYIRRFAIYVRDHLDPRLKVRAEYSNEMWNWGFRQADWALERSQAEWGEKAAVDYHVKKAVENARIWREVFGADDETASRLVMVLGGQAGNPSPRLLKANRWKQNEPENYTAPAEIFDELAITHYFGGATLRRAAPRNELLAAIHDPDIDAASLLTDRLRDPGYKQSIPRLAKAWAQQAKLAQKHGLRLVAYEGGQHLHQGFKFKSVSEEDFALIQSFMADYLRSPAMADLYAASWEAWAEVSDGPFMQFGDMTRPSKWGTWGIYESLDTATLRAETLVALNAARAPWWEGAEGGPQFQQGVTLRGGPNADDLAGTPAEDYLLGGPGDDILHPGPGDDGVHGGPGRDLVVLAGRRAEYRAAPEGAGYRVIGPDGSDLLVDIEALRFSEDEDNPVEIAKLAADG